MPFMIRLLAVANMGVIYWVFQGFVVLVIERMIFTIRFFFFQAEDGIRDVRT